MTYPRLAQRLYNTPLCITQAKAEVIESVFRSYSEGGRPEYVKDEQTRDHIGAAAAFGANRRKDGYAMTRDGVAVVPIVGTLVQRAGGMDAMSGLTSYEQLSATLDIALSDHEVTGLVLDVDSPGGEAAGVSALADQIRGSAKPVVAVANEAAFSAAYWLASAAQYIYVPATGMVGSVGVIMLHVDQSKADEKRGLVYTPIFAGQRKNDFSSHEPLSNEALASAQAMVVRLYDQFVSAVAANRGIDAQTVRDTEAGILDVDAAAAIGMVSGRGGIGEGIEQVRAIRRATR